MPSYELILTHNYQLFYTVWKDNSRLLYRHARHYMEIPQKPLNSRIGCELTSLSERLQMMKKCNCLK